MPITWRNFAELQSWWRGEAAACRFKGETGPLQRHLPETSLHPQLTGDKQCHAEHPVPLNKGAKETAANQTSFSKDNPSPAPADPRACPNKVI